MENKIDTFDLDIIAKIMALRFEGVLSKGFITKEDALALAVNDISDLLLTLHRSNQELKNAGQKLDDEILKLSKRVEELDLEVKTTHARIVALQHAEGLKYLADK